MRALVATGGSPGRAQLADVEPPQPAPHEAVVAVRAVSLNRGEVNALVAAAAGWRPGWDLAGEVVTAAADGSGPAAGSRVVGLVRQGAWAEQVAVAGTWLARLPEAVGFAAASTLPVAGLTALRALRFADQLDGARILVTGAAGGVGRFAIQLACTAGAVVTAVVGRESRARGLAELGAGAVVVGLPSEGPFDLILESVGGESMARALELVGTRGVVVSYGVSSRQPTTFDAGAFFRKGGTRLCGLLLFEELNHHRSAALDLAHLVAELARGALDPQIALETSWRDADGPFEALLDRRVDGKAVLHLD
jgi:NADPH:quinone reductase-like Zn-dependent oxidoreductase